MIVVEFSLRNRAVVVAMLARQINAYREAPNIVDLDISTALQLWFAGHKIDDDFLYSISILWLGRTGKCLQFLGALAILAEIAGPARLRNLSARLRSPDFRLRASQRIRTSGSWMTALWTSIFSKQGSAAHAASEEEFKKHQGHPAAVISLLLAITAGVAAWRQSPYVSSSVNAPLAFAAFLLTGAILGPLLAYVTVGIASALAIGTSRLVLEPLARLIDGERPELWIKVGATACVAVGFLLDLFAS